MKLKNNLLIREKRGSNLFIELTIGGTNLMLMKTKSDKYFQFALTIGP